ncbi:hypothetical protein MTO96_041348 [Rhipicephalus appendiculatus]
MATFPCSELDLVQCPYNPNHKVKQTRIDIHVSKCRREVGSPCLRPCFFNPDHLVPSKASEFRRHLETCPDRSSTLPVRREDLDTPYVVPVTGASRPLLPQPEEIWEVGPTATYQPREPPVPPVFRQVHGLKPSERRLYYRSLFENGPPEDYAPAKQPKAQVSSPCSKHPTHAVHAQAESSKPRGAQAASSWTILNDVNWPSCAQAYRDQTSHTLTRKSWAQKVAPTTDSQLRSTQARQPRRAQTRDGHPRSIHAVQGNQRLGGQASPAPVGTWSDPVPQ